MEKILVVDDDKEIAALIADALADEGFEAFMAHDGSTAMKMATEDISLIILDIMMPGMDGLEVCRKIRDSVSCPILFVTARNRTLDTLLGLEMGADDYITKPFVVEELIARVKAHLRRQKRDLMRHSNTIKIGRLKLCKDRFEVYLGDKRVDLSTREFQLLSYLCENEGRVLTREQIFDAVWGTDYGDIGTVAVNIKNLRDKLDKENNYIKTVWGVGYKLVRPEGEET